MRKLKNLLIATTLLCSAANASMEGNQDAWDRISTHSLKEEPRPLNSLMTWMDPITVVLPASSLHFRTQLVLDLISYYNEQLKPTVDRRLLNIFIDYNRDCTVDMHSYLTFSLDVFVENFTNKRKDNRISDLVPAELYIDSSGYYAFTNIN